VQASPGKCRQEQANYDFFLFSTPTAFCSEALLNHRKCFGCIGINQGIDRHEIATRQIMTEFLTRAFGKVQASARKRRQVQASAGKCRQAAKCSKWNK
jgi:hypothetical protein